MDISLVEKGRTMRLAYAALALLLLQSCGGGSKQVAQAPPDLSGVWAGTWSGTEPGIGPVTGTWEAELAQTDTQVTGSGRLAGDIDCPEGTVAGTADTVNNTVSGTLNRAPCPGNTWTLTALNTSERKASGLWEQQLVGSYGTFTGMQIAKPGGPRIKFFTPRYAPVDGIVTVVGTGFAPTASDNKLQFNANNMAVPEQLTSSETTLVVRVPAGASNGHLYLTTPQETAISAAPFNFGVYFPKPVLGVNVGVDAEPEGLAISVDGRKLYVASKASGTVNMHSTASGQILAKTGMQGPVQSIAVSPDGIRIYVASGSKISIFDAATVAYVGAIAVPSMGGSVLSNPQGIAISPDGKRLLISDAQDNGAVSLVDVDSKTVLGSLSMGTGNIPRGVAFHPDGSKAYVAVVGLSAVRVLSLAPFAVTGEIAVGAQPAAVVLSPSGRQMYVTNELEDTLSVYDFTNMQSVKVPVGTAPVGLALAPGGNPAYVVNRVSNSVSVVSTFTNQQTQSITGVDSGPIGIAMSPDGKQAFVSRRLTNSVSEIGGTRTLSVAKWGGGIGTVTASAVGIDCGTACQARVDVGTTVNLLASAGSNSYFSGWSSDCPGGQVTVNANTTCTAYFNPSSSGSGGGGGGGCFIATAAYGSPMAAELDVLRGFRDRQLMRSQFGRMLIEFYYRHSPPIAAWIQEREAARAITRIVLWPVVWAIKEPAQAGGALMVVLAVLAGWRVRRRRASAD